MTLERWGTRLLVLVALSLLLTAGMSASAAETVTLVSNGETKCCVVVGKESAFKEPPLANWDHQSPLLKWGAEDVATYLGKISGAEVHVVEEPIAGLLPIFVGCVPEEVKLTKATEFGDAYVVDVSPTRIVLHGESRRAVHYAAAQLLTECGVRWYAPGELGEVVPSSKTIVAKVGRREFVPDFTTRNLWMSGPEQTRWAYRNRMGSPAPMIPCGFSLHGLVRDLPGFQQGAAGRNAHPELYNVAGEQTGHWPNFAHPEVIRVYAKNVIEGIRKGPVGPPGGKVSIKSLSVSPDGGYLMDDRPEIVTINGPVIDPILRMPSFSETWFGFLNQVCAEIDRQTPGLEFTVGSLAHLNFVLPPKKVKLDRRIIPVITPVTFNRYTSMGKAGAPASELFEQVVTDWTATSPRVGLYLYNYNRADMAMPYSRRVPWTKDFPKYFALGIKDMTIESHPNWHTMMPANYVASRLLWDTRTNVNELLDEYYPAYYGTAAKAMRGYDTVLENAYESTQVFAVATWGMHRILTPQVMSELDQALTEAEQQAQGHDLYKQRVEVNRLSHNNAVLWFAAREALNSFRLAEAASRGEQFLANLKGGNGKYPLFFPPNDRWSANPEHYFELLHNSTFKDAGRIAREGHLIYTFPDEWTAKLDPVEGVAKPNRQMPDLDKGEWRPLKTFSASLDEQGQTFFRGVISYQHKFELPKTARDAKVLKLWFGGVDTRVHVWLNGTDLGEKMVTAGPHELNISAAIARDGSNTLLVSIDNTFPNQLGVGGITRPVLIYAPKPSPTSALFIPAHAIFGQVQSLHQLLTKTAALTSSEKQLETWLRLHFRRE